MQSINICIKNVQKYSKNDQNIILASLNNEYSIGTFTNQFKYLLIVNSVAGRMQDNPFIFIE